MTQQDLFNIVRGVVSYLHTRPVSDGQQLVVVIEAPSTLIFKTRGNVFGV